MKPKAVGSSLDEACNDGTAPIVAPKDLAHGGGLVQDDRHGLHTHLASETKIPDLNPDRVQQDMNSYEKTVRTINEVKTLKSHMESLGKILATSEDDHLRAFIAQVVFALQHQLQHSTSKSIPTSLMFYPVPQTIQLLDYCKFQNQQKKPEWQVLAERNGWAPKHFKLQPV